MIRLFNCVIYLLLSLTIVGCEQVSQEMQQTEAEKRQLLAVASDSQKNKNILIGIAWSTSYDDFFLEGVRLARDEINAKGGLLGRQIELIEVDEQSFNPHIATRDNFQLLAYRAAHYFAQNRNIVAVIGHKSSSVAIPASIIYDEYGLLYLAPTATNLMLTRHNFKLTFRLSPDNDAMGEQLAGFCFYHQKYKRIVILHERTDYSEELSDSFYKNATRFGIEIVHRSSFFADRRDFRDIVSQLKDKEFDAVFVSGSYSAVGRLIKQMHQMHINTTYIGTDSINSTTPLWKAITDKPDNEITPEDETLAKQYAEGIITPATYNAASKTNITRNFVEKFRQTYHNEPDSKAVQGYDALKLLAYAIKESNSTVPIEIATTLHYMPMNYWVGASGVHQFTDQGEIKGKKYYFQQFHNGQFELIAGAHVTYLIEQIKKLDVKQR